MEEHSSEADTQLSQDIHLMGPDIDIIQDIEQDLEDYSRLAKLGRFGAASAFFEEVLSRNLSCFAVLAEHCHALIDQGDFMNAELILSDCLNRQSKSVRGADCFEPDEKQLLSLLLTYVRIFNGLYQRQEEETSTQIRWSFSLIDVSDSTKLTDAQRQIILICLRIYGAARINPSITLEDLRLPWLPQPSYPGEIMTVSNGYLVWFEDLLAQHLWDANIILQHLDKFRAPSLYHQDYNRILRMLENAIDSDLAISSELFAHMSLMATLYETALLRIWSNVHRSPYRTIPRIGSSPEAENLIDKIKQILQHRSGDTEVVEARPYKRLQLSIIDHETLRYVKIDMQKLRLVLAHPLD
ncbi:hypothetical protein QM012_009407 [Aureobasidium pullulans]|uniref:Uncharacterized protein n=1 Tax=Aureobasidium pullulans TaxID=5580 RepID=A0ABR0TIA1_AURPU